MACGERGSALWVLPLCPPMFSTYPGIPLAGQSFSFSAIRCGGIVWHGVPRSTVVGLWNLNVGLTFGTVSCICMPMPHLDYHIVLSRILKILNPQHGRYNSGILGMRILQSLDIY